MFSMLAEVSILVPALFVVITDFLLSTKENKLLVFALACATIYLSVDCTDLLIMKVVLCLIACGFSHMKRRGVERSE